MKTEIAKIWIDALRSDKYEQTTGILKDDYGYCCLGVLCEISGLGKFAINVNKGYPEFILSNGKEEGCVLPDEILEWADISDSVGHFEYLGQVTSLSELNDDSGKTFLEIADIIELNIKNL